MSVEATFAAICRKRSYHVYFGVLICLPWSSKLGVIFLILRLSWCLFLLLLFVFQVFLLLFLVVSVFCLCFSIPRFYSHVCHFSDPRWVLNLKQKEGRKRCQLSVPAFIRKTKAFLAPRLKPST